MKSILFKPPEMQIHFSILDIIFPFHFEGQRFGEEKGRSRICVIANRKSSSQSDLICGPLKHTECIQIIHQGKHRRYMYSLKGVLK